MNFIEKILNALKSIPVDKQLHFYAGAIIGFSLSLFIPFGISFIAVIIIGALKELYDYYHPDKHTCDFYDWLATSLGGCYVSILYAIKLLIS